MSSNGSNSIWCIWDIRTYCEDYTRQCPFSANKTGRTMQRCHGSDGVGRATKCQIVSHRCFMSEMRTMWLVKTCAFFQHGFGFAARSFCKRSNDCGRCMASTSRQTATLKDCIADVKLGEAISAPVRTRCFQSSSAALCRADLLDAWASEHLREVSLGKWVIKCYIGGVRGSLLPLLAFLGVVYRCSAFRVYL